MSSVAQRMPFTIATINEGAFSGRQFRHTNETPRRDSVIDWIRVITGVSQDVAGGYLRRIVAAHPEVRVNLLDLTFPGRGQRPTPVADANGLLVILNKLITNVFVRCDSMRGQWSQGSSIYIPVFLNVC